MKPEVEVLGISIKTFGVAFAFGFLACGALVARRLRELGRPVDWAYEITFAALLGGVIGARVYYLIENASKLHGSVIGNIFSGSGLVWYGGAIGGALAVVGWMRWRGVLELRMLDMCATALALGYAIGRIGCQVSGDGDYGIRSTLPTSMSYPHGTVPTPPGVTVLPTPIYETVLMCLLAWGLWQLRDRVRPGVVFALYLIGSGFERFMIEFVRRNSEVALGLTGPQLESLLAMAAGLIWLGVLVNRGGFAYLRAQDAPRERPRTRAATA